MTTVRQSLNNGNPNSIATDLQMARAGEAFNLIAKTVRAAVVANVLVLPEDARALRLIAAYGIGTASGWKTPRAVGDNTAPSAGEAMINGAGNIVFNGTDAITLALVIYNPIEGEIFEDTVDVASNVATLLGGRKAAALLSVNRLVGTATGLATPVHRPTAPAAGAAAIGAADDGTVAFQATDAVTRATIRYLAVPGIGATTGRTVAQSLTLEHGAV